MPGRSSDSSRTAPETLRVKGKFLVVPHGAILPDICVVTGERVGDAGQFRRVVLHHLSPAATFWVLLSIAFGPLRLLARERKVALNYHISDAALQREAKLLKLNRQLLAATVVAFVPVIAVDSINDLTPFFAGVFCLVFVAMLVVWLYRRRVLALRAVRIDDRCAWVRGIRLDVMHKIVAVAHERNSD